MSKRYSGKSNLELNDVEKKMNFNWITKIPLQKAFVYFLILIIIFILILASIF
jgi:hypothetical protein